MQDFLATLDELVDHALEHEVDLVLFCGDAYKSRDPSQTQQREFARRIARLSGSGVPVYLVVGNHDLPYAAGRATALDIYPTLGVPLVQVGGRIGTAAVTTRRGEILQVLAVPWVNRSWLLTREEYQGVAIDVLNKAMEARLDNLLRVEFAKLDPAHPAVVAGHLAHTEAVPGSERRMTVGADPVFLPSLITGGAAGTAPGAGAVEYAALGHIHKAQEYQSRVPVVYSGSLQRIDFGEEGQAKGFFIVDLEPGRPIGERLREYRFVPVAARAFTTIAVRSRSGNPTADVLRAIERRSGDVAGAVVRVQVNLESGQEALLDDAAVRRALAAAHYCAGIQREVEGGVRSRLGGVSVEGLTPIQALERYLNTRETPAARTQDLLAHARPLIAGHDEAWSGGPSLPLAGVDTP